jgi:hypothetical protein
LIHRIGKTAACQRREWNTEGGPALRGGDLLATGGTIAQRTARGPLRPRNRRRRNFGPRAATAKRISRRTGCRIAWRSAREDTQLNHPFRETLRAQRRCGKWLVCAPSIVACPARRQCQQSRGVDALVRARVQHRRTLTAPVRRRSASLQSEIDTAPAMRRKLSYFADRTPLPSAPVSPQCTICQAVPGRTQATHCALAREREF